MQILQFRIGGRVQLIAAAVLLSCTASDPDHTTTSETSGTVEKSDTAASHIEITARYCAYNQWANHRMAEWLSTASEEMMRSEIESSFDNLRKTALHIWSAEYLWLQVLKDRPYDDNPTADFDGTDAELIEGWLAASAAFHAYSESLDEIALQGTRGSGADRPPLSVVDIIQHCMNHSTYHRGQLITMGRQAGLENPPQTDFIHYVRSGQKPTGP